MTNSRILLCIGLLFLPGWAAKATPPDDGEGLLVITLRPGAKTAESLVRLGDVATLRGGSEALREKIARLDLAEATTAAAEQLITRDEIYYRLLLAGLEGKSFRLAGPAHVRVGVEEKGNGAEGIVAAARDAIRAALPTGAEEVSLRLARPPQAPTVAASKSDVRYAAEAPKPASGKVRVDVHVLVRDKRQTTVQVYFDVSYAMQVAVARRRIGIGETVAAEALSSERLVLAKGEAFLPRDEVLGKKTRGSLFPGQRFAEGDVENGDPEPPVLVKQRDMVRLVARIGAVRVTAVGEAQQEGRRGQLIRVRNTASNKVVSGRVIDRSLVEVGY